MKSIINLLFAGTLFSCTNNVEVISYKVVDSETPKNVRQIPTKDYGWFEFKEYEKGSEVTPLGGLNGIKPLRDIDGDGKPDEIKYDTNWVAIEKNSREQYDKIYKSIYSSIN